MRSQAGVRHGWRVVFKEMAAWAELLRFCHCADWVAPVGGTWVFCRIGIGELGAARLIRCAAT